MKASILAIGTEITQGQIINSNASFISSKLSKLGVETSRHLAVPDDRTLVSEAMDFLSKDSEIIFVTGGLGPTTDDFTREVIAKWCELELVYDEHTFKYIKERLDARGVPVRESQKQQCYFPKNSKILFNSAGTAHGFFCTRKNIKIFVLPGPPKEVEAVWVEIEQMLPIFVEKIDRIIIRSFDCTGLGESEIAHLTEEALKDCKVLIGYRVHYPNTEVKLMAPQSNEKTLNHAVELLEEKLRPYIITRG